MSSDSNVDCVHDVIFFHFHAVFGKSYARSATDSVVQLKEDKKPTRTVKVFLEEIYVFTGW